MATSTSKSDATATGGGKLRFVIKWIVLPYIIGWTLSQHVPQEIAQKAMDIIMPKMLLLSPVNNDSETLVDSESEEENHKEEIQWQRRQQQQQQQQQTALGSSPDACFQRLLQSIDKEDAQVVEHLMQLEEDGVQLVLHRNGDVEGCGMNPDFLSQLRITMMGLPECPVAFTKYETESILTSAFHQSMLSCASEEDDRTQEEGFLGYCDMGEAKTPILLDHDRLIPVVTEDQPEQEYLPCHFHSREGVRVTSFQKLMLLLVNEYKRVPEAHCEDDADEETCVNANEADAKEVHLYAVPAGRTFMFAPAYVGEEFDLPHIQGADPSKRVYMKVLSLSPRVFDIFNYFTRDESAGLVEKAIAEKSDSHKIKRSSTGASGYNINMRRTSESGFDTHGKTAQAVKKRCFSVLGFDEYIESHSDGLQILRYNQTKAYTAHMDWIDDDGKQAHNYDSAGKGGNRFATILLYMTDLGPEDGGETVFIHGKSLDENPTPYNRALKELRMSEHAKLFKRDSWEEKMVAKCRSSLAVVPNSARAVLFYSQLPNGRPDPASLHGGCPVLTSEPKWAASKSYNVIIV